MESGDGRRRPVIERVTPAVDAGRFSIKRIVGEEVVVEADIFSDGHDALSAVVRYWKEGEQPGAEAWMEPLVNDRWRGSFRAGEVGAYRYTVVAWVDHFKTWRRDLTRKVEAAQSVQVELLVGSHLIEETARKAAPADAHLLAGWAATLRDAGAPLQTRLSVAADDRLEALMIRNADRGMAATYEKDLRVDVDRDKARFSAWYEMFPRSCASEPGRHGTFQDCEARLPYVASMGFDVLYLPPIHPIGRTHRKGKNNSPTAGPADPGSPWGIGSEEGGHQTVHPELGTLEDFRRLLRAAREHGLEIALDLAYQCSPDHPYVKQHRNWFRIRPDGSLQYAENPPKKYEDIYPLNFETEQWAALWEELKSIVLFWIGQGVRIFRVDNPHTKPFPFWEWLIRDIKRDHPDVIFLAEAFTRPKVMHRLAKLGFTQSYTYFAWRNTKIELMEYLTELTQTECREYFRPNLWPNTPDILTEQLQHGGRPAFMARLVLAATMGANYGVYGPAFELCEHRAREAGSEEYLDSEKYEIKHWPIERPDSLRDFIGRVNQIRRENPALHGDWTLHFHAVDNDQLICYSKHTSDRSNVLLIVVNLNPYQTHAGWVELDLDVLGIQSNRPFQVHDLLANAFYLWQGPRNYVELNPHLVPAHIFAIRRDVRSERDFAYYM
jgi:starch synthase (maltosyl-transferring)